MNLSSDIELGELASFGGFADVYEGVLTTKALGRKKVAVKRFRVHLDVDKEFAKVCKLNVHVPVSQVHAFQYYSRSQESFASGLDFGTRMSCLYSASQLWTVFHLSPPNGWIMVP